MINQREIIVYALIDILEEQKYNNIVLKQTLKKNNALDKVQKAFITECVNGTLRNLLYIDYILNFYSKTSTEKMKPFILNLLRCSIYQIKFMDKVPDSAVCNEAVNLAKSKNFNSLSGFINGVLRSIIRNSPVLKLPLKNKNFVDYISIKYSMPKWIIKYWQKELSDIEIEKICEKQNISPYVTICVNTLKISKVELIKILENEEIEVLDNCIVKNALKLKRTSDITKKESFKKGLYHVMDESSMICVNSIFPEPNNILIDVCSAPGGKSFYSSILMNDTGKIFSYDIHDHKINIIKETQLRLGLKNIIVDIKDAEVFDETKQNIADYLLVDAPCSGFGMLQKKPDIKYTKKFDDIKNLVILQRRILKASAKYVKPGGILVYSTCTISKFENTENVKWFLENFDFELDDIAPYLPKEIAPKEFGLIQILPYEYNTDGFFIARFKRKVV